MYMKEISPRPALTFECSIPRICALFPQELVHDSTQQWHQSHQLLLKLCMHVCVILTSYGSNTSRQPQQRYLVVDSSHNTHTFHKHFIMPCPTIFTFFNPLNQVLTTLYHDPTLLPLYYPFNIHPPVTCSVSTVMASELP